MELVNPYNSIFYIEEPQLLNVYFQNVYIILYQILIHNPLTPDITPQPILTLDLDTFKSYKSILKSKGGIYSFINTVNGKQYIEIYKDFF